MATRASGYPVVAFQVVALFVFVKFCENPPLICFVFTLLENGKKRVSNRPYCCSLGRVLVRRKAHAMVRGAPVVV